MSKKSEKALRQKRYEKNRQQKLGSFSDYDLKDVLAWVSPKENGAPIITMPNVPAPLFMLNPRTIMGQSTWDHVRKRCYYLAGYKCEICGRELGNGTGIVPNAHELYSYNFYAGEAKFERCVCVCPLCHQLGIHSGRALSMYKRGNPMMPRQKLLEGAENAFRLVYEWNKAHPDETPLRLYKTFIEYARWPDLAEDMKALLEKYPVGFYQESPQNTAEWGKWHLVVGGKSYKTPYKNQEDMLKKLDERTKSDPLITQPSGGVYDEIDKIISA